MNIRRGPLNQEEKDEQRELYKQLRERIRQLRMREPPIYDDDEKDSDC